MAKPRRFSHRLPRIGLGWNDFSSENTCTAPRGRSSHRKRAKGPELGPSAAMAPVIGAGSGGVQPEKSGLDVQQALARLVRRLERPHVGPELVDGGDLV